MENQELTDKEETKQGNYDSAWKEVIELHLEDFLKFFFPKVHREIDFSKGYESLNQELRSITPKSKTGKRLADVLVKVHLKGKKKTACIVIFIHIEIQGSRETGFERRVFIYFYRIFDLKIARDAEIISLMILTDEDKNYRPDKFVIDRMGFNLRMKVPMVKIIDYKNKPGLKTKLEKSKSPMALVVKAQLKSIEAKKKDNNAKAFIKRELVYQLFRSGYKKEVIGTLLKFLDYIFSLPEELEEQLKQEIIILEEENKMAYVTSWERIARKEGKKDGIEEGKKEGKKEGRKEGLLEAALEFIKNGVGLDIIARSTGLSMAKLEELAQNAEITVH
ncbi:MAG: cytosolic protein [bacterium]|nr:cytosolic protein [bacterium]